MRYVHFQDILYSQGPSVFAQVTLRVQVSHMQAETEEVSIFKNPNDQRDFNKAHLELSNINNTCQLDEVPISDCILKVATLKHQVDLIFC